MTSTAEIRIAPPSTVGRPTTDVARSSSLAPWVLGLIASVVASLGSWIPSLWGDEAASVLSATRPIGSLFAMLTHVDAVHGTYYFGLHWWIAVFGASPFSVRMPPAIAVGLAVVAVVLLVRRLADPRTALVGGVICILLPRFTYMGEETRSYAFSAAVVAWAMLLLVDLVSGRRGGRRWWVLYGVLIAVGVYIFMYTALLLVAHAILLAAVRAPRRTWRSWLIAAVVGVSAAGPVVVFSVLERSQIAFLSTETTTDFTSLAVGLWFWTWWYALIAWALIVGGVASWSAGLIRARRRAARVAPGSDAARSARVPSLELVGLVWLAVPGVILLLSNIPFADFTGRYLSMSAPGAGLLMAAGVRALAALPWRTARVRGLVAVLLVVGVSVAALPSWVSQRTLYAKNQSDWAEISTAVGAHASPGGAVVFDESTRPSKRPRLALHTYPAGFRGLTDVTLSVPYTRSPTWYDRELTVPQALADGRFRGYREVWLIEYSTGKTTDTYGLADLEKAGYRVSATYRTHRSEILELRD
ncbi:hypothetical protein AX769_12150 [Frondihabitans sp. PAMC 28766]|uniref:glycosyltransferase family 39 protein n=1 Tax=Frondihabitans sp. PAMC 28766 TaxID=1795630 RepID=UPI00078CDF6B|nr:glycosyltransferase family 39 protein [Frondihabitans sp. PAMC 28766]AMM20753.1 hypothetical protein AX769_12150 [Frondihabitans sp. PAMC 28766]